jgi:hypothetical protein
LNIVAKTAIQFRSTAAQDGWVLETSESSAKGGTVNPTATTFLLGDSAKKQQYRSLLSFDTASLPDNAVITRGILKIRRHSLAGTNPFTTHKKIAVDIRKGAFGTSASLQPLDFQALAHKSAVGLIANAPQAGGWYSAKLTSAAYPYIKRNGITQLRLAFQKDDDNDLIADLIRFYSGNAAAASRPILVIQYHLP